MLASDLPYGCCLWLNLGLGIRPWALGELTTLLCGFTLNTLFECCTGAMVKVLYWFTKGLRFDLQPAHSFTLNPLFECCEKGIVLVGWAWVLTCGGISGGLGWMLAPLVPQRLGRGIRWRLVQRQCPSWASLLWLGLALIVGCMCFVLVLGRWCVYSTFGLCVGL